jgi:hypothetical protein
MPRLLANVVAGRIGQTLAVGVLNAHVRGSHGSPDCAVSHLVHSGHHDPSTRGTAFSHSSGPI